MTLGDLLARLETDAGASAMLRAADPELRRRSEAAAAQAGLGLGAYVSGAVRHFLDGAGDADWMSLMAAMGRSEDPGAAALRLILAKALAQAGGASRAPDMRPRRALPAMAPHPAQDARGHVGQRALRLLSRPSVAV